MADSEHSLTLEQQAIAYAPRDARIVVEAGAGTGKTHTLVERLRRLIDEDGCRPAGILVLSFSKAVVHAIRRRTKEAGLTFVDVRTFDSFALELAGRELDDTQDAPDFDRQIESATVALLNDSTAQSLVHDSTAQSLVHDFEHVLVDEVQDLVKPRSDMVRALLSQLRCGFTMFGDRAQAIYGFAVDRAGSTQEDDLLSWAMTLPEVTTRSLSQPFRARGKWPVETSRLQELIRSAPELAYHDLVSLTYRLPVVSSLPTLLPFIQRTSGRVAFLCRTNGDALVLSEQLDNAGIAHALNRGAHERVTPKWLAQAVAGAPSAVMDAEELAARLSGVGSLGGIDPEAAFEQLRRIGRSGPRRVDLQKIAGRVRRGQFPPSLANQSEQVVVSTIHRAKGLEFEHIVLCTGDRTAKELEPTAEAARVLFVALTRAQNDIFRLDTKLLPTTRAKGRLRDRWTTSSFRGKARRLTGLEFRTSDIDVSWCSSLTGDEFAGNQQHLAGSVNPGDRVSLTRQGTQDDVPVFVIEHQGICIGRTSAEWGTALLVAADGDLRRIPKLVMGLRIDRVVTAATSTTSGADVVGASGLYLQAWLRGLAATSAENLQ